MVSAGTVVVAGVGVLLVPALMTCAAGMLKSSMVAAANPALWQAPLSAHVLFGDCSAMQCSTTTVPVVSYLTLHHVCACNR